MAKKQVEKATQLQFYDVKLRKKVMATVTETKVVNNRRFAFAKTEDGRRLCRILSSKDKI